MFNIITKTWNPVTGCYHSCIYCWARKLALRKLRNAERYRNGFIPKLNQGEFNDRFDGGIVFVSDMGDLLGDFIPRKWIESVINYVKKFLNTYFLLLTKNPARYHEFLDKMPSNIILGVTIETNRDDLYLKKMISKAPLPSKRYEAMQKLNWDKKFISIEPILDFDLEKFAQWIEEIEPLMIYIGYDNYNNKLPEPSINKTLKLIEVLSETTLIIKKTIRSAWNERLETFIA
jgi:DNA repair photolyase